MTNQYVKPMIYDLGVPGKTGAIGHQFRNWLTGYKIAKHYNLTFAYMPFIGNHVQNQIDVPVKHWEPFLNFGHREVYAEDLQDMTIVQLPKKPWSQARVDHPDIRAKIKMYAGKQNVLFECPDNQFMPIDWDVFRNNRFKANYWKRRQEDPRDTPFNEGKISIAVHMRRGDVTKQRYPDRYLSNDFYINVLTQLTDNINNCEIHIFSEGDSDNFKSLMGLPNIKFHLSTDVFETFHAMVAADIFVTGIGSFSILAAHLSNGMIITKPWNIYWQNFPPQYHEIVPVTSNGNINLELLSRSREHVGL